MDYNLLQEILKIINEIKDYSASLADSEFSIDEFIFIINDFIDKEKNKLMKTWGSLSYLDQRNNWDRLVDFIDGDELALTIFFCSCNDRIKDERLDEITDEILGENLQCIIWGSLSYEIQKKYWNEILIDFKSELDVIFFKKIWKNTKQKLQEEKMEEILKKKLKASDIYEIWDYTNEEIKKNNTRIMGCYF